MNDLILRIYVMINPISFKLISTVGRQLCSRNMRMVVKN